MSLWIPHRVRNDKFSNLLILRERSEIKFTIIIPFWLVRILIQPVLLYRRVRYGYTFCRIPLTQGKYAIVDPDDYFRLSKFKWFAAKSGPSIYAVRSIVTKDGKKTRHYMHREVLKVPNDMFVDHINNYGLDNRKANLRPATKIQNSYNRRRLLVWSRSRYRGLCWDRHPAAMRRLCLRVIYIICTRTTQQIIKSGNLS